MENLPSNLIDDSITAVAEAINKGKDVFADGVQFTDFFHFIPTALSVQVIVEKKDELIAQVKDYSLEERSVSIEKLKAGLTFTDDVETIVGLAYDVVFAFLNLGLYLANRPK